MSWSSGADTGEGSSDSVSIFWNHYLLPARSPNSAHPIIFRWEDDSKLCSFKFFKFNDVPSAPGVTEEEVIRTRQKLLEEAHGRYIFHDPEEYKHKESLMEGESKKDTEKELQEKLHSMHERIHWTRPRSKEI